MVTQNYSVRLEPEFVERLDRLAHAMSEQVPGLKPSRTQALRTALDLGLAQAEAQFGLAKSKRPKTK